MLDVNRYDQCIAAAVNSHIYAYSWYLDIVANHWGVLVYGDYEAVMPLPWKRRYGIKYIVVPFWVQQLGVFSAVEHLCRDVSLFTDAVPGCFMKITYQFNDYNEVNLKSTIRRPNYILALHEDYQTIFSRFSKMRQRIIRSVRQKSGDYTIKQDEDIEAILQEYRRYIQFKSNYDDEGLKIFEDLYQTARQQGQAFNLQVWEGEAFLSGVVFFKDNHRIYSLFLAQTERGKQANTTSLIYSYLIEHYQKTPYILDFEGSSLPGVAKFIKSFGASDSPYVLWQETSLLKLFN
ncbi:MAG: hypothetical protein CSA39_01090 [Flavobacteriales bacterium]|nr:MAG: hypothetical protein CSA39_01090 [Flavobacteriales bacterium]